MKNFSKNLYLFILWEKGREKEKEILEDISKNFDVFRIYDITWKKEDFARSLARFYGKNLPKGCKKECQTGGGSFLAIWVSDPNETLENGNNSNIISTKSKYRMMLGANLLHASDNCLETEENTLFLLGKNLDELHQEGPLKEVIFYNKNIAGFPCWLNKEEAINFIKKIPETTVTSLPKPVISTKYPRLVKKLLTADKSLFLNRYYTKTREGKLYFGIKRLD